MAAQLTVLSPDKLRDELLIHPLMLSIGSLTLSTFMSHSMYGVFDLRPVVICVTSDILAIGMDHYFDQERMLSYAIKTGDLRMIATFRQAKILLLVNASLLIFILAISPPLTWVMVTVFFGPAFVWDFKLFVFGRRQPRKKVKESKAVTKKNSFTIKRIPGMKAILIGVIRGCGTFAIVSSILSRSSSATTPAAGIWGPTQIIVWSTVNRACHAVMADIRDFHEDWEKQVPTIPVLLQSVVRTKILLTFIHVLTTFSFYYNPYIVFASLYATVLVWFLHENSPRGLYRLSFHSQTLTAILYGISEVAKRYIS